MSKSELALSNSVVPAHKKIKRKSKFQIWLITSSSSESMIKKITKMMLFYKNKIKN
jgi:hypothetical protein